MTEKDTIQLPWHPESDKPNLPFVICTDGEGHYWIGRWKGTRAPNWDWQWYTADGAGWTYGSSDNIPLAWIKPDKFVPFNNEKKPHYCMDANSGSICTSVQGSLLELTAIDCLERVRLQVKFCPFCGQKAGEK